MKNIIYTLLATALIYLCFSITSNDFDFTTWHYVLRGLFAYLLLCIGVVFLFESYTDKK